MALQVKRKDPCKCHQDAALPTSTGDALLVDFTQMSHAALVGARPGTLAVHRRPGQQRCLGDGKLLQDTWEPTFPELAQDHSERHPFFLINSKKFNLKKKILAHVSDSGSLSADDSQQAQ